MTVIYMPKQSNGTIQSSNDLNQLIDYVRIRFYTSFEAIGKELEQTYYQTESILENLQKERTDLHKTLKQVEKEMLYYDKSVDRYEDYQQEHTKNKSQHSPRL